MTEITKDKLENKYKILAEAKLKEVLSEVYKMEAEAMKASMSKAEDANEKLDALKNVEKEAEQKFNEFKQTTEDKWEEALVSFETSLDRSMNSVIEDRKTYLRWAETKLDLLNTQVEDLERRLERTSGEVKMKIKDQLEEIKQRRADLKGRYDKIRESSGDAWKDLKSGFEDASRSLVNAFNKAMRHF